MVIYTSAAFIRVARNMDSLEWVVTVFIWQAVERFDLACGRTSSSLQG